MMPPSTGRRIAGLAGFVLLSLAVLVPGCARPPDETWLRVVSFGDANGSGISSITSVVQTTTTTSTTTTTATGTTDYVSVFFANQSAVVENAGEGVGVTIDQVRITYDAAGYSLPGATYAVSLYVPVSTVGETTTNMELQVALVSTSLKSWLVANVPSSVLAGGLSASARLEFHARTDQGAEIEVAAGIGILFENNTGTGSSP